MRRLADYARRIRSFFSASDPPYSSAMPCNPPGLAWLGVAAAWGVCAGLSEDDTQRAASGAQLCTSLLLARLLMARDWPRTWRVAGACVGQGCVGLVAAAHVDTGQLTGAERRFWWAVQAATLALCAALPIFCLYLECVVPH